MQHDVAEQFPSSDERKHWQRRNNNGDAMKVFFGFIFCTVFIFAAVNWFVRPLVPIAAQVIPALNIWHCAGASAVLMIAAMFFDNGK